MQTDYDSFTRISPLRRGACFSEMTPEAKAALVIEHWRRFLDANRSRLTAEQIGVLEEGLAFIRPERYVNGVVGDDRMKADELETRLNETFPPQDMATLSVQVLIHGGAIANRVARCLARRRPQLSQTDPALLFEALRDLATLPVDELRRRRYGSDDAAALLGRVYERMPEGEQFWSAIEDEDVRLAAQRAITRAAIAIRTRPPD